MPYNASPTVLSHMVPAISDFAASMALLFFRLVHLSEIAAESARKFASSCLYLSCYKSKISLMEVTDFMNSLLPNPYSALAVVA